MSAIKTCIGFKLRTIGSTETDERSILLENRQDGASAALIVFIEDDVLVELRHRTQCKAYTTRRHQREETLIIACKITSALCMCLEHIETPVGLETQVITALNQKSGLRVASNAIRAASMIPRTRRTLGVQRTPVVDDLLK